MRNACAGDATLQAEIEELLECDENAGDLLEPPDPPQDSVLTGRSIAHFEVLEKLGEGGMGTVYKARDTRLERLVAIKMLHRGQLADPERRRRFVLEARAASALNHPNIATIYDIIETPPGNIIVMEYVPGKTLDRIIPLAGLPAREAAKYAVQIAEGLAAAHDAGIVHRDVKPGNILVSDGGVVKVVDFGLAKLRRPFAEGQSASDALEGSTGTGRIVGTVAYISPEQAEGKRVDARSDIFAFGAVLYEMISGRRAFNGDSIASTLAAVLKEAPEPLSKTVADVPRDLDALVMRCLQKDPGRRVQTMVDVLVALHESLEANDAPVAATRTPSRARRLRSPAVFIGLLLVVSAGWLFWQRARVPVLSPRVEQLSAYSGIETQPTFSPDGSQVAFTWNGGTGNRFDIYVKLVGDTNPLRLTTGPAQHWGPAWSPDGKRIAFLRMALGRPTGVYLISPLGGAEGKIADFPAGPFGPPSWSPDGRWLAVARVRTLAGSSESPGIFLLPVAGGEPRRITTQRLPGLDISPAISPDGTSLAYSGCTSEDSCDVYVQELNSDYGPRFAPHRITQQQSAVRGIVWAGDSLIYSGALNYLPFLWRVNLRTGSQPERLELAGAQAEYPTVARTGNRLAFSRRLGDYDIWRCGPDGSQSPIIQSSLDDTVPRFSPDGTRIVFASARSGTYDIWLANADGSNPIQMTNHLGRGEASARWSPDGRWIAFDSRRPDRGEDIYVMEVDGGKPRLLVSDPSLNGLPSWSRDGRWIYFFSDRTGRGEIWRVPSAGGKVERITDNGGFAPLDSADGRTLFYTKGGPPRPLYARPLAGGPERKVLDGLRGREYAVFPDGIYYSGPAEGGLTPLLFYEFSTGASRVLTRVEGDLGHGLSVSPDRKTVLFSKSVASGRDLMLIENFR